MNDYMQPRLRVKLRGRVGVFTWASAWMDQAVRRRTWMETAFRAVEVEHSPCWAEAIMRQRSSRVELRHHDNHEAP